MDIQLDFVLLDDLALAWERHGPTVLSHLRQATPQRFGPLIELGMLDRMHAGNGAALAALPSGAATGQLLGELLRNTEGSAGKYRQLHLERLGAVLTSRNPRAEDQVEWLQFCRKAQEAAEFAALPKIIAHGLVGAMRELEDNIHLHSQRTHDGIVAFRATLDEFEFVVADSGIGVLQGLRGAARYSHLTDAGTALKTALSDGQSRLLDEDPGRGFGFHELFVSLANLNGELRFRSDDHALTIDGSGPALPQARLAQKARLQGFVISIVCTLKPSAPSRVH